MEKHAELEVNDIVLILEDKDPVLEGFKQWHEDAAIKLDLVVCKDYEQYEEKIKDPKIKGRIKCLIMDLSNNKEEEAGKTYKSVGYIKKQYEENRIPIFIHSGFLDNFSELEDKGTVFKIPKNKDSIGLIGNSIKTMHESGFLNIFSHGGSLENKIMSEIHNAFVSQFKGVEIEEIIKSISKASKDNIESRTQEVFERIALRAVYQNTISNTENKEGVKVNSIEHYYRRSDKHKFWTGDIFICKDHSKNEMLFVATPRCNVSNGNFEALLFFKINEIKEDQKNSFLSTKEPHKVTGETKGGKQLRTSITDDVTNSNIGERFRFLPKTPQFEGGFVDLMKCITISEEDFLANFSYVISLVDDLTNDVIRKAAAYLLRGGISDTAFDEALYYFEEAKVKQ